MGHLSRCCARRGRIGGATDLFAIDCPAALIQVQGRWDSDIALIYQRVCLGQSLHYAARAALSTDPDLEAMMPGASQPARRGGGGRRR